MEVTMGHHRSTDKRNRIASICLFASTAMVGASTAALSAPAQYQDQHAVHQFQQRALVVSQYAAPSGPGEAHRGTSQAHPRRAGHHDSTASGVEDRHWSPPNAGTVTVDTPRSRDSKLRSGAPPYQK
jgi:hypothetical protein